MLNELYLCERIEEKLPLEKGGEEHTFTFFKPVDKNELDPPESAEQINLVNWAAFNHPELSFFAVVNEQSVDNKKTNRGLAAKAMQQQKRQGLKIGTPDTFWVHKGKVLLIEMKKHNGNFKDLRETQRKEIKELNDSGQDVFVCFGFHAAKTALIRHFDLEC